MSNFLRTVALLLLAATAADHAAAAERVRIAVFDNPPLITFSPYENEPGGIFMNVVRYTASREGWDLEYVPGSIAQGLERLERGEVDILPAVPHAIARENRLTFSRETLATSWGRIYVKPGSTIASIRDLAGKKVAVLRGSLLRETLLQGASTGRASATVIEYTDFAEAFRAVARGEADAVLCNRFSGPIHARDTGLLATRVVLAPYGLRYASRRGGGKERLLDALDRNSLLLNADPDSFYYQDLQKLENDAREPFVPGWVRWAAAGALSIVVLALGWALTLRRAAARIARSEAELRRTHEELCRITENSLDVIAVLDAEFNLRRVNRASGRLFACRPEDMIGKSALDWVPKQRRQVARRVLEQVRSGARLQGHAAQVLRADGTVVPVLWSLVWSEEAKELYAIGHDDTERHDLIASLTRRTQQLQVANRELETFAQTVSHDLRSPVAAVVGFVGKVLRDEGGVLQARSRELLTRAHAASHRMEAVIADLLRLARVTEGGIRLRPCDVSAMCHDVVATLRTGEPERHVTVEIQAHMRATADRDLLRHVFDNLLANAWKFTSRKEQPCITIGCEDDPVGTVFFVEDNGAGFDMTYARNLFRPFSRLHNESEFSGTGIGLSIVHRVVAAHGGRIWAEARPGSGAVFRFTLAEPQPAQDAACESAAVDCAVAG